VDELYPRWNTSEFPTVLSAEDLLQVCYVCACVCVCVCVCVLCVLCVFVKLVLTLNDVYFRCCSITHALQGEDVPAFGALASTSATDSPSMLEWLSGFRKNVTEHPKGEKGGGDEHGVARQLRGIFRRHDKLRLAVGASNNWVVVITAARYLVFRVPRLSCLLSSDFCLILRSCPQF
jgi:hypothetical protein